ncbi:MAG: glycosyltransferase family 87 protein [Terriglobales bacterium]
MRLARLWHWPALALVLISYGSLLYGYKHDVLQGWVDFRSMYTAAWMVRDGAGEDLYRIPAQREAFRRYSPNPMPVWFYHPPFEVPLFLPFTFLPYASAYMAWLALNALLLGVLAGILFRSSAAPPGLPGGAIALACFTFFPAWYVFLEGQDSIFIALSYALAYAALKKDRDVWAGFLFGLGLFRFQLVLPVMFVFFLLRRWRVVVGFGTASILLALTSLAVAGWQGTLGYPQFLRTINQELAYGSILPQNMPNLRGQVLTYAAWRIPLAWVDAGVGLVSLALLVWVARKWKRAGTGGAARLDLLMALTLVVTLIVSYHLNLHDMVILLLPLSLVARHLTQNSERRGSTRRALAIATTALFLPAAYLIPEWPDKSLVLFCLLVVFALAIAQEIAAGEKPAPTPGAGPKDRPVREPASATG